MRRRYPLACDSHNIVIHQRFSIPVEVTAELVELLEHAVDRASGALLWPKLLVADQPVSMVSASLRATIVGNIVELNHAHGIGIVDIMHDITTAYHVAQEIIVLSRGLVVERGNASVIESPQLVSAIPMPDPGRRQDDDTLIEMTRKTPTSSSASCAFASRCPEVMAICGSEAPPLTRVAADQAAACHRLLSH